MSEGWYVFEKFKSPEIDYEASGWSFTTIAGDWSWVSPDKKTFVRIFDKEEREKLIRKYKLKKINELNEERN